MTGLRFSTLILFLLLLPLSLGLEASVNRQVFSHGEQAIFTVQARPGALLGGGLLYGEDKPLEGRLALVDETGFQTFSEPIRVLDPPGDYARLFLDAETGESVKVSYAVKPVKPAALSIILLEPVEPVLKNTPFKLSFKVLKGGEPLEKAFVFTWDAEGRKVKLLDEGRGVYAIDYTIHAVSGTLDFPLEVYAVELDSLAGDWGLEEFSLDIERIDIGIELVSPANRSYSYEQPFEAVFRIDYPEKLGRPLVKLQEGPYTIDLARGDEKLYPFRLTALQTLRGEDEPIVFSVIAYDRYGNRAEKEFSFAQEGYFFWFWRTRIMYVIFPAVFLLYLSFMVVNQYIKYKKPRGKEKKK